MINTGVNEDEQREFLKQIEDAADRDIIKMAEIINKKAAPLISHDKFNGLKIVVNNHITDAAVAKRSWKERLFTRPFKPFEKFRVVNDPHAFILDNGTIVCSQGTYNKIMKQLEGK